MKRSQLKHVFATACSTIYTVQNFQHRSKVDSQVKLDVNALNGEREKVL